MKKKKERASFLNKNLGSYIILKVIILLFYVPNLLNLKLFKEAP